MRVKPYIVLGAATLCAGAAVAIVVIANDPYASEPVMIWLFWIALFLALWGLVATLLTVLQQRLVLALAVGALWAAASVGTLLAWHLERIDRRLSGIIFGATIVITLVLWISLRRSKH